MHDCPFIAWPISLADTWTCPECSREYSAYDPGTPPFGWRWTGYPANHPA